MSSARRIVIPGDDPPQIQGSPHLDRLRAHGEVILYTGRPGNDEEKLRRAAGATCILNSRGAVHWTGALLRQLPHLRMITACGIGTDAIDVSAARELGIRVCNVPGQTAAIVAEHALALLLAAARRIVYQTQRLRQGQWRTPDNVYLGGKLLGVVGAGPIGARMVQLARALGMRVQAWTFRPTPERAAALGAPFVSLEELLRSSDAISLHLPLTDRSRGLIGARELGLMKPGALLVNTARGAIVDTPALVAALESGHLGGAGIDVFDQEPLPPDHPLLACAQVALTPHVADQNPEGMELLNRGAADNVIAFLEGRPQNCVV